MKKSSDLTERLENAVRDAVILSDAMEFVRLNADGGNCTSAEGVIDILYILQQFSRKNVAALIELEVELGRALIIKGGASNE